MTKRTRFFAIASLLAALQSDGGAWSATLAQGGAGVNAPVEVAAGCETPSFPPSRRAFHVDSLRGAADGDGSRVHPWKTLQDVLAAKMPHARGGAIIYLARGNYGAVSASADNDSFIEIAAEPGQTPVLQSLEITGSRWIFSNLKIQSVRGVGQADHGHALVEVRAGTKPANNIIIRGAEISPSDDAAIWSPDDWLAKGVAGIEIQGGVDKSSCVALLRNTIRYTGGAPSSGAGWAVQFHGDHSLFVGNIIDHFADDAIDYGANNIVLRANVVTNNVGLDDSNHNDAMQGYTPGGQRYKDIHEYRNVVIQGNLIIRQTDPNLHQPISMQGINNFAATPTDWYNVLITDNVVITNAYHGITFGAVHHAVIANNTVLADGHGTSQLYGGQKGRMTLEGQLVWIMVTDQINHLTTPGGDSSDVVVSSNIAQTIQIQGRAARVRDNVVLGSLSLMSDGVLARYKAPGVYGEGNVLDPSLIADFKDFHPAEFRFDVKLRPGSRAAGKGSALADGVSSANTNLPPG